VEKIMDWIQFAIFIVSILGMFSWLRADIALNRTESSADRRDMLSLLRELKDEMKDFHGRLCAIEERNKGK